MLDSSSDEETGDSSPLRSPPESDCDDCDPLDIKQEPADDHDIMSISDSPLTSPSKKLKNDLAVQGTDGYPYHDYLTETKHEPMDDKPHPNAKVQKLSDFYH